MNSSIYICPVCRSPLFREGVSWRCGKNHCYDISREGYVNLLLANQKQSRDPGDSREMLQARRSFLNRGYYKPLARAAASAIIKYRRKTHPLPARGKMTYCHRRLLAPWRTAGDVISNKSCKAGTGDNCRSGNAVNKLTDTEISLHDRQPGYVILDAGCGEGYYTDYISRNRSIGDTSSIYGIDISREGIKSASKRNSSINFAVAGIFNLPFADRSVDLLLNIFAPFDGNEFSRVLKDDGIIISVTPGARHLYEFKKFLYDDAYLNDEAFEPGDSFKLEETIRISYELNIHSSDDIANLLKMTPYYHKSSPEKIDSFLGTVRELKTCADFLIHVLKKH